MAVEDTLTPDHQQLAAITSDDASVLIIAGPGAGKTRVLAARLSYLLLNCICSPRDILVLSFTRSGAFNLRDRANQLLEGTVASASEVYCDTFHGFCGSILKKYLHLLSFQKEYMIIDDSYQSKIMKELLMSKGIPHQDSELILRQIRLWKELGLGYVGIRKKSLHTKTELQAYEVFPEYQRKLKTLSYLDFGDLLLNTLKLFRKYPNVLQEYRQRFRHVLIDEFQDVSPAQYDILRMLANGRLQDEANGKEALITVNTVNPTTTLKTTAEEFPPSDFQILNARQLVTVFCAGDDDQSIYGWRGAQIHLMRRFKYDFPSPRVVHLQTTYRLPDSICSATSTIVEGLADRIPKVLNANFIGAYVERASEETDNKASESPTVVIQRFSSERKEVEWIASHVQQRILQAGSAGVKALDVVILTRTRPALKHIENVFREANIPFCNKGKKSWAPPKGTEAAMSLLRLLAMPQDSLAFEGALFNDLLLASLSRDEIGSSLLPVVREYADARQISHMEASRECILKGLLVGTYAAPLTSFISKFDAWRRELTRFGIKGEGGRSRIYSLLKTAFAMQWNENSGRNAANIAGHLSQFDSLLSYFDAQADLPEQFDTELKRGSQVNVWLMTMMAAKGLEFDEVYLPHWVEGTVPTTDNDDERRLAFVSLTRAKKRVYMSYAKSRSEGQRGRVVDLQPSPYISELLSSSSPFISHRDVSLEESSLRLNEDEYAAVQSKFDDEVTIKAPKTGNVRRIVAASPLPSPSDITAEAVAGILSNPGYRKTDLQQFLRKCLALRGCLRGTVEVTVSGVLEPRALSRCTADQLGEVLIRLLQE